jgi:NRAMP (natural resistance-associated macrophage protein)-like metal ion transporter
VAEKIKKSAKDAKPPRQKLRWKMVLAAMGPGLVAALAGTDAGGIATYSNAGAMFGYGQLWTVPIMCFLLIVVQETAARMGCVTGKGFASLIREQFGVRLSAFAMLALLVSNTMVTLSEFAGIASGMELFGIPTYISVPVAAIVIWLLTMSGSYKRIEKVLLAIACVFLVYIVAGFMVEPDWGEAIFETVVPQFEPVPEYLSLLVANIGTTIAPWMIFLQESNVVESNVGPEEIPYQRIDTCTGAIVAAIISWFIIMVTGTVLHPAGIAVESSADAAKALAPIVGPYAETLFGVGLVGASLLAACVLPGITASAICEAFGWERGADHGWSDAPIYRGILTAIIILSTVIVLIPNVNLFGIMMAAQVINGILLPVLLVYMVKIASDKRIMGRYVNGRTWTIITWVVVVAIVILTIIMFVLQALGY